MTSWLGHITINIVNHSMISITGKCVQVRCVVHGFHIVTKVLLVILDGHSSLHVKSYL